MKLRVPKCMSSGRTTSTGIGGKSGMMERPSASTKLSRNVCFPSSPLKKVTRSAKRDRALRMNGGQLLSVNGVKCAEQIELAVIVRCRVTQNRHLNIHSRIITGDLKLGE